MFMFTFAFAFAFTITSCKLFGNEVFENTPIKFDTDNNIN